MNYDTIAKSYNELHKEEQLKKLNIIKKYLKVKKSDKLLDIGAGTGISANFFDCGYIGIEASKNMIKNSSGNIIYGLAEKLPFKDKTFDIIISITAIHNFKDPERAINEILRVKKDKAQVVITLLKKSKNYNKIKKLIKNNLKVKEIDEEKDTIFLSLA